MFMINIENIWRRVNHSRLNLMAQPDDSHSTEKIFLRLLWCEARSAHFLSITFFNLQKLFIKNGFLKLPL